MMGVYTGVDMQFSCRSALQDGMRVRHLLGIAIGDDQVLTALQRLFVFNNPPKG